MLTVAVHLLESIPCYHFFSCSNMEILCHFLIVITAFTEHGLLRMMRNALLSTLNSYFHRGSIEGLEHPGLDRKHQEACRLSAQPFTHFSRPQATGSLRARAAVSPRSPLLCESPSSQAGIRAAPAPGVCAACPLLLCPGLQVRRREAVAPVTYTHPRPTRRHFPGVLGSGTWKA